ncbi:hypothetical protein CCR94_09855 [Rhodoblastus sphagnicola]|uniref:Uncharacterized protein n=1 Tax=Rhodoblastus sphagnicola TaxID=333368 RepID=A0A2S6N9G4_9HYPH|nr:hypothetical protein [Rhodoblastus sphagnicola]MBB4199446.1 hypothetical protein [Rhodoblastus sphagnicola]PPQ31241.1 hypothetical protein CCR94_09855 [Rhodoblastus sphagnicola]
MITVVRFLTLAVYAAGAHFLDGTAFAALIFGALIGWLAVRFYWLALPAAGLANLANLMYANSTGEGKSVSALGNFPLEFFVFLTLAVIGYLLGLWVRHIQFSRLKRLE